MNGSGSISSGNSGLVTGGTVYNGLQGKANVSHTHTMNDIIESVNVSTTCSSVRAITEAQPNKGTRKAVFTVGSYDKFTEAMIDKIIAIAPSFSFGGFTFSTNMGPEYYTTKINSKNMNFSIKKITLSSLTAPTTNGTIDEYSGDNVIEFHVYGGFVRYICYYDFEAYNNYAVSINKGTTWTFSCSFDPVNMMAMTMNEGDLSNQLAIAELAEVMDANNTANQLAIAEIAEMMLTGE